MLEKDLKLLLEEGSVGLDLSPGNDLCKKAHKYITELRADLKKAQDVAGYLSEGWEYISYAVYEELGEDKEDKIRQWIVDNG